MSDSNSPHETASDAGPEAEEAPAEPVPEPVPESKPAPVVDDSSKAQIYVTNLLFETEDADLQKAFEKFGTVVSCVISRRPKGKSKGFGFVTYATHEEAMKAMQEMNEADFQGRKLTVEFAKSKSSKDRREDRRSDRSDRSDRHDRGDRSDRSDRHDRSDRRYRRRDSDSDRRRRHRHSDSDSDDDYRRRRGRDWDRGRERDRDRDRDRSRRRSRRDYSDDYSPQPKRRHRRDSD